MIDMQAAEAQAGLKHLYCIPPSYKTGHRYALKNTPRHRVCVPRDLHCRACGTVITPLPAGKVGECRLSDAEESALNKD